MKRKPIKIGQITLSPKMVLGVVMALFILGIGIGATVASANNSKFALLVCAIISLVIIAFTFSRK